MKYNKVLRDLEQWILSSSHAFRPPRIPKRQLGSERSLRRMILQLDEAEPDRGLELYVRLRPLHERLTRHQAVMMLEAPHADQWEPLN